VSADDAPRLHKPAAAAELLGDIPESWLRKKAAARAIPCTFLGKHLRFSDADLAQIIRDGAKEPATTRRARRPSGLRTAS
jgi:hypothetical protein